MTFVLDEPITDQKSTGFVLDPVQVKKKSL